MRGPTCTKWSLPVFIIRYAVGREIPVAWQNSLTLTQMRAIGSRARGPRLFCRIGECSIDIGSRRYLDGSLCFTKFQSERLA